MRRHEVSAVTVLHDLDANYIQKAKTKRQLKACENILGILSNLEKLDDIEREVAESG